MWGSAAGRSVDVGIPVAATAGRSSPSGHSCKQPQRVDRSPAGPERSGGGARCLRALTGRCAEVSRRTFLVQCGCEELAVVGVGAEQVRTVVDGDGGVQMFADQNTALGHAEADGLPLDL